MVCIKYKPNFDLKSCFFYFAQSLFKTTSIQFSISNSILFKYYFFINFFFFIFYSTETKQRHQKKNPHQLHQQSPTTSAKNPANLQTCTAILQTIIVHLHTFTEILLKISKPEEEER